MRSTPVKVSTAERRHLIRTIAKLSAASQAVRAALAQSDRGTRRFVASVERGSVSDGLDDHDGVVQDPRDLTRALAAFEAARHEARNALIVLALSEGFTLSQIAQRLGLSRQLLSCLAQEVLT